MQQLRFGESNTHARQNGLNNAHRTEQRSLCLLQMVVLITPFHSYILAEAVCVSRRLDSSRHYPGDL